MLKRAQEAVAEFHRRANLPAADRPRALEPDRLSLRAKWILEEIEELTQAVDIVDQADAALDIVYFALGIFVEMGIDGSKIFDIVHAANMSKLSEPESLRYDADGKVLKPVGWLSPEHEIAAYLDPENTTGDH